MTLANVLRMIAIHQPGALTQRLSVMTITLAPLMDAMQQQDVYSLLLIVTTTMPVLPKHAILLPVAFILL